MQVVHSRDYSVTWSASLYRIGLGSQAYDSLFEEFLESYGNTVDEQNCFSSTDRWPVGEDYTGFRGHAASMCPGS